MESKERKESKVLISRIWARAADGNFPKEVLNSIKANELTFKKIHWLEPNDIPILEWEVIKNVARMVDPDSSIVTFAEAAIKWRKKHDSPA
ncbi:MAG: hypothetical protein Q8O98_00365 [bacterium]|nr:hypothetical protein [bacterium]